MREFQLVNLADLALVGDPVPLPPEFANLSDAVVSDFSAHIDPPPVGYAGKGLLPLVVSAPLFDPETEADTGVPDLASRAVDAAAGIVRAVSAKRPLTPEEIGARNPVPESVSLRFWRTALKLWKTDDGSTRFAAVEAAIAAVEKAGSVYGLIAREAFEYANTVDRPTLLAMKDVFGFTVGEVDESLWRADRIGHNDFSGVWPLQAA